MGCNLDFKLYEAVEMGLYEEARSLIGQGAVPGGYRGHLGKTCLMSVLRGAGLGIDLPFFKLILEAGADVTEIYQFGDSCLHYAVQCDKSGEVTHGILNAGASTFVNLRNGSLGIAIIIAVRRLSFGVKDEKGKVNAVRHLLHFGASPAMKDRYRQTYFHACSECSDSVLEMLCDNESSPSIINHADVNGGSPLQLAVLHCNLETVRLFLKNEANVNFISPGYGHGFPFDDDLSENSWDWQNGSALHVSLNSLLFIQHSRFCSLIKWKPSPPKKPAALPVILGKFLRSG
ncbi:hypothetical protein QAD02_003084 [Eretmocerus hayati]|uniref:Uncharacterized protein n=1 Tax=Eretmocerus hayati TaxID=131215 RepID=A0ACC2NKV9_9HYME|nr:hypothetical protein QAD02_003084 [Eretmocerus hayati]